MSVVVFEASDRVGGRVASDVVGGFVLDRGFQVLLDSYPEAQRWLDLDALEPGTFAPGALVRQRGAFHRVVDPWRSPLQGMATLKAPFVSIADGLRMASLRSLALDSKPSKGERTTDQLLREHGFSEALIESFFRPFFGGVTLDRELSVPDWYFLMLFGWFAKGSAVLPARGMQAIPEQMASKLPAECLRLDAPVEAVTADSIQLASGERIECRATVIATDSEAAQRLLGESAPTEWLGTTTLFYEAAKSPVGEPILVLNGEGPSDGPVNHLCVLTDGQPSYGPQGRALIAVSVLGVPDDSDAELDARVRAQLSDWYGEVVASWSLLRVDRIPRALPRLRSSRTKPVRIALPLVCGDHVATPSIQGSLESGSRTAEAVQALIAKQAD